VEHSADVADSILNPLEATPAVVDDPYFAELPETST
jgi:hypothetical protein